MSLRACRSCGAPLEIVVVDLGKSPLSNAFLEADALNRMEPFYPLKAYACGACLLVQLEQVETPQKLFADYAYFSSFSESWLAHCRDFARHAVQRFALDGASMVLEVASNDGYLLQYFRQAGIPVTGIEPAVNVAKAAVERGVPTIVEFLGEGTAARLAARGLNADLIVANNVLAHVPDLNDFIAGLAVLLKPEGTLTIEFPHLLRMIAETQFDTIYHEHFSYLSLLAADAALRRHRLEVYDVEELPTHGGSLRLYVAHAPRADALRTPRPEQMRTRERAAGLDQPETYLGFAKRVRSIKYQLLQFLLDAREQGRAVAGYGAPAKASTLLNYCGIGPELLSYTVDRNPAKQGRYIPGRHIPIFAPGKIDETRPDYVLLLPWNLREEIVAQMAHVRSWGGKFVIPAPLLQVLP